ncbi:MAG: succinate dehydrogenase/fumarate reductase iron-sulfur subunit [Verrucomicrobia bacterium]|nr:succinate dehydrogenase/fumarate reductase iron-sulfur subunit [Verrucomicrobiota bacterium]MCF7707509.1 succinate dehydrogenase/fumarate reductase iron-sulfur subunit [Verrucomicrobiota bacterium]
MNLTLKIWRQQNSKAQGEFVEYKVTDVSEDISFLEMLDVLNEDLIERGEDPVAFDSDCREGICGACSIVVNGIPHGHQSGTTVCQLHMRHFDDSQKIVVEPFRAKPFPIIKDLVIDRSAMDRVIQAGGFISVGTNQFAEANAIPVPKDVAESAMDAASCIGCGACVAVCKNASAMLFVAAKVSHLNLLPQGKPEKDRRVTNMIRTMDAEGFGNCTNIGACETACPKGVSLDFIAQMNRDYAKAIIKGQLLNASQTAAQETK